MRKMLALSMSFVLIMTCMTACTSNNEKDKTTNQTASSTVTSDDQGTTDIVFDSNEALFYANAADGYSIMESEGTLYCVDAKGNITYMLPESEVNVTHVYNGVFLTYDGKKAYIRDYKGEKIAVKDAPTDLDLLFLAGTERTLDPVFDDFNIGQTYNDIANQMLADGYLFAYRATDTYAGSTFEIGFLKPDGNWHTPLSSNNPLLTWSGFDIETLKNNLSYCGEGIIKLYVNQDESYYYDIAKNKLYKTDAINAYNRDEFYFHNGVAFLSKYDECDYHYALFSDGTSKFLTTKWPGIGNWICFYDKVTETATAIDFVDDTTCLVDSTGKVIKRFDGEIAAINPIHTDETIQILFVTENDKYFYTKTSKNGEFLFEPIALEIPMDYNSTCSFAVFDLCGNTIGRDYNTNSEYVIVVDDNGKILYAKNGYKYDLRNGILKNGSEFIAFEQ